MPKARRPRDDLAPDLVLAKVVKGKVAAQAGVVGRADAVFAAGPAAVA
jgi:hypothetical protein